MKKVTGSNGTHLPIRLPMSFVLIANGVVMTMSTLQKCRGWEDCRPPMSGLVPETSRTAVSGLHFPTFFCLGRDKAEMWKVTGYLSTLLLCLEILCLQSDSNWTDILYNKLCRLFPLCIYALHDRSFYHQFNWLSPPMHRNFCSFYWLVLLLSGSLENKSPQKKWKSP